MLAITYKKITKIKVAEWGTPKKLYLKKKKKKVCSLISKFHKCMKIVLLFLKLICVKTEEEMSVDFTLISLKIENI